MNRQRKNFIAKGGSRMAVLDRVQANRWEEGSSAKSILKMRSYNTIISHNKVFDLDGNSDGRRNIAR